MRKINNAVQALYINFDYTISQRCMGSAVSIGAVVFPFLLFANGRFCDNKIYIDTGKRF